MTDTRLQAAIDALVQARAHQGLADAQSLLDAVSSPEQAYAVAQGVADRLAWFRPGTPQHWKSGGPSREAVLGPATGRSSGLHIAGADLVRDELSTLPQAHGIPAAADQDQGSGARRYHPPGQRPGSAEPCEIAAPGRSERLQSRGGPVCCGEDHIAAPGSPRQLAVTVGKPLDPLDDSLRVNLNLPGSPATAGAMPG